MDKFTLYDDSKYENHATNELPLDIPMEKAAKAYAFTYSGEDEVLKYEAFKAGAKWQKEKDARDMLMSDCRNFEKCYELGKKDMKEQMINKACEWLSNLPLEDMTYKYNDFDSSEGWYKFIEDFRKAMEKEK